MNLPLEYKEQNKSKHSSALDYYKPLQSRDSYMTSLAEESIVESNFDFDFGQRNYKST